MGLVLCELCEAELPQYHPYRLCTRCMKDLYDDETHSRSVRLMEESDSDATIGEEEREDDYE